MTISRTPPIQGRDSRLGLFLFIELSGGAVGSSLDLRLRCAAGLRIQFGTGQRAIVVGIRGIEMGFDQFLLFGLVQSLVVVRIGCRNGLRMDPSFRKLLDIQSEIKNAEIKKEALKQKEAKKAAEPKKTAQHPRRSPRK